MARYALAGFTARFNALFDVSEGITRGSRAMLSVPLLQQQMASLGFHISMGQLQNLRSGSTSNPGGYHLDGLAQAFGVTPLVWFSDASFKLEHERLTRERDARRGHEPD